MPKKDDRVRTLTEPVVFTGSHEPLSFRRRKGGGPTNETEIWEREHSEALVKALAARGVTWVRAHFFKGNGLKWERPEIERTRQLAELCHKYGIKIELYTQFGTLQYETLLDEVPTMESWAALDELGQPIRIRYGHQDFRYKPCATRDGYWKYLAEVIRVGIQEVKGDGFGFDNVELPDEPDSCHCPECRKAFVAFLKAKYPTDTPAGRERATERFGFPMLDHIRPPVFNRFNPVGTCRFIQNPVMQEWTEFKCESLRRRFEEVWRLAKGLKPNVMIEYNVYPPAGKNAAFYQGIDMHRLGPYMNVFWNERQPYQPEYKPDGLFWHRVHSYKLAEALGCEAVLTDTGGRDAAQQRLSLAETLAFDQGHPNDIGGMIGVSEGENREADAGIAFRKAHADLFEGARPAAEVGLFESAVTLRNSSVQPYIAEILAMNGMLAGHVPFDLVPDLTDTALARYPVLVLPDVECLSDEEAQRLMAYVEQGGAVVLTERTGFYDHWLRRRPAPALAPMLKDAKRYPEVVADLAGRGAPTKPQVLTGTFGQGRFAWLSRLEPVKPFRDLDFNTDGPNIDVNEWHVPANAAAFVNALRAVSEGRVTVSVKGPPGLAAEVRRAPDGRRLVHLVNYVLDKPATRVSISLAETGITSARLWTPWDAEPRSLTLTRKAGTTTISVGSVPRYGVIEIR